MRQLIVFVVLASAVFGQDLSRTFKLTNTAAPGGLMEIATTLRTVFNIQQLSVDPQVGTLTVMGSPSQVALAEWLVPNLDVLPGSAPNPRMLITRDNTLMVYGLANTHSISGLQKILTNLRTVLHVQKIYQQIPAKLVIIRGEPGQIQLAQWLLPKLDTGTLGKTGNEMQAPGGQDDVLHVFYLPNGADVHGIYTKLRAAVKVPVSYPQTLPPATVVRSTANQVALVGRFLAETPPAQ